MIPDTYGWLVLDLLLAFAWFVFYFRNPWMRHPMVILGLICVPYAFAEVVYIPKYWNPPSVLDVMFAYSGRAARLEIEAFLCAFIIAGVAAFIYASATRRSSQAINHLRPFSGGRWIVTLLPYMVCPLLYFTVLNKDIAMAGYLALAIGGFAKTIIRPSLFRQTLYGGFLFLFYYMFVFEIFILLFPGYVDRVWTMQNLSGTLVWGIPIEEIWWGLGFGFYASGLYEYISDTELKPNLNS